MRFLTSLRHALDGLAYLFRTQRNARLEAAAALLAVALGGWLGLSAREWALLAVQIALVLALEAMNTALESLCDEVVPERRPRIKAAKDLAAGAVLAAAASSLVTGCVLFLPKLLARVS